MFAEAEMRDWWESRTDDQRARLKRAAEKNARDSSDMKLLFDSQCPIKPVGTQWGQSEVGWSWPDDVRKFILAQ